MEWTINPITLQFHALFATEEIVISSNTDGQVNISSGDISCFYSLRNSWLHRKLAGYWSLDRIQGAHSTKSLSIHRETITYTHLITLALSNGSLNRLCTPRDSHYTQYMHISPRFRRLSNGSHACSVCVCSAPADSHYTHSLITLAASYTI